MPDALSSIERRFAIQVARRLHGDRMGKYDQPVAVCPYCRGLCDAEFVDVDAEFVDVGVGMQQVTPYRCDNCYAVQIGPYDTITRELTPREKETGWYEPAPMEELENAATQQLPTAKA